MKMKKEKIESLQHGYDTMKTMWSNTAEENCDLRDKIAKLEDRHQSDCITINQLQTTIDVLVDKLARLREIHGL